MYIGGADDMSVPSSAQVENETRPDIILTVELNEENQGTVVNVFEEHANMRANRTHDEHLENENSVQVESNDANPTSWRRTTQSIRKSSASSLSIC